MDKENDERASGEVISALQLATSAAGMRQALLLAMPYRETAAVGIEIREAQARLKALKAKQAELECAICLAGSDEGPLEDICGHGHPLHAGCASLWHAQCLRLQAQEPEKHAGPHCPTCKRAI